VASAAIEERQIIRAVAEGVENLISGLYRFSVEALAVEAIDNFHCAIPSNRRVGALPVIRKGEVVEK
jgi:hypothetical protein